MAQTVKRHLDLLYGANDAPWVAQQIDVLLENWRPRLAGFWSLRPIKPLTQQDALLITYADQLLQPGQKPLQTLTDFCEAHLREMVGGVHVLPFYPWSSDDGFSVRDYFSVDPTYGSWEDLGQLGQSFDLMFDGVFNHVSAQGDWFQRFLRDEPRFRDFFITVEDHPDLSQVVRPRALPLLTEVATASGPKRVWTTFSADQVDLNFRTPRVLLAVLEALLFYAAEGAKFIRLDAIAFLWKEIGTTCVHRPQTHAVIQLMRSVLDLVAPSVQLITETNVAHADNLSYFGDGTNEAQLVYNFALPPLVLHSLATGSARQLTQWAQSLILPSERVCFLNFLASHDGIGLNPGRGILSEEEIGALVRRTQAHGGLISYKHNPDGSQSPYELNITWFDALNDPASTESLETQVNRFIVSQAILLALAGVPAIYFHSLFGSRNDRAAANLTGISRRINRQRLPRRELERELATPDSLRARVFSKWQSLLRQRRCSGAFDPHGPMEILALDNRAFSLIRSSKTGKERVLCLHNISHEPLEITLPHLPAGPQRETIPTRPWERLVRLDPYQFLWTALSD